VNLTLKKNGALGVGLGWGIGDELKRLVGKLQKEFALRVLEDGPKLHEMGDERAEPRIWGKSPLSERDRYACSVSVDPELTSDCRRGRLVEDVRERVGLVARRGKEPRLDRPSGAHALDPAGALGEPDIAQAAPEEAALIHVLGYDAECAEPSVDDRGVDALAIVGADNLVAPAEERREAQAPKLAPPSIEEVGIGGAEAKLDAPAPASSAASTHSRTFAS